MTVIVMTDQELQDRRDEQRAMLSAAALCGVHPSPDQQWTADAIERETAFLFGEAK